MHVYMWGAAAPFLPPFPMCTCFLSPAAQPVPSPAGGDGEDRHHPHPGERGQDQGPGGDQECVSGGKLAGDTF